MQKYPLVAIVILNYNTRHYLQQFLPYVIASAYPNKKIVVADNASTDDSVEWMKVNFPGLQLVINENNYGFAKGYNEVLKLIEADYYVLLNSDVQVTPRWIDPIIELMEKDKGVGACQPKVLSYKNKGMFEYAGAAGGWIDRLGYPFSRGRIFDVCEEDKGQYNRPEPVFWASGAALFVVAALYHKMKGFDEYFFAHQEEIDLCWRMQLEGHTIMCCPESVVYHVGGGTLPQGQRKVYLNFRNNLVMLVKNLPATQLLWKLPLRIGLDALSAWKALLEGDSAFFKGVLKAHVAFAGWIFSSKEHNIFASSAKGKLNGYYNGSIVWQYFIKKKKTFSEILKNQ